VEQVLVRPENRRTKKGEMNASSKLKAALGWLGRRLPGAAAFFLLSIAQCFSVPSPYAICCLAALISARVRPYGAVIGVTTGFLLRIAWGISWDLEQLIACLVCLFAMKRRFRKTWEISLMAGLILLGRAMPGIIKAEEMQSVILHITSVLLGVASMPALCRAAQIIRNRRMQLEEDDLLCMLLPCLLMIAGSGRLAAFGGNIGYCLSAVLVLMLSWMTGGTIGICGGMACGAALLIGGQNALMLINLSFGAFVAGLFQRKNRLLSGCGFLLASAAITYLTAFAFVPSLFFPGMIAAISFCILPGRYIRRMALWVRRIRWTKPKDNAYTRLKMQRWVRAIEQIASALPKPRMEERDTEEESEEITEKLCLECDRLPICWHEQFDRTKGAMMALTERQGPESYLHLINEHFSFCERIGRIPGILNEMDEARQKRCQRVMCAEYERAMIQTHLSALSQAAQLISLEGSSQDGEEGYWLSQVEDAIGAIRFPGEVAFAKRVDGRMAVCLKCDPLAIRAHSQDALVQHISIRLHAAMQITENKNGKILLEEEPPLVVFTGVATACAMVKEREGERMARDNGDAVLVRQLSGGQAVLALSDGMGHGAGAQDESRKTLELLAHCIEAGYTRSQAMTAVNGMMLSATGGEKFATVDLCMMDLWTGEAWLNKLGACASVLVQGQKLRVIEGEALPLGIIEYVVPMEHRFMLGEGDLLLLMSDGITDAFSSEEEIYGVIRKKRDESPQRMAESLLQAALMASNGLAQDDMTVLCARVASRHPERKRRAGIA